MVRVEYLAWEVRADVGERANTRSISPRTFRSTCRIGDTQGNRPRRTGATLTSENPLSAKFVKRAAPGKMERGRGGVYRKPLRPRPMGPARKEA